MLCPSVLTPVQASAAITASEIATELDSDTITTAAGNSSAIIQYGPDSGSSNELALSFAAITPAVTGLSSPDVSTTTTSSSLITTIDTAITTVSNQRATLGGLQNNLERMIANLGVTSENLSTAESRIRDLDIALETVEFT